jgi:hypothetical protein
VLACAALLPGLVTAASLASLAPLDPMAWTISLAWLAGQL